MGPDVDCLAVMRDDIMEPRLPEHLPRRRVRNWASAGEQRRLFWILVPIVLLAAWAERAWLGPTGPPPPPPIDTILDRGPVTRTIDDGITIEAPPVIETPIGEAAVEVLNGKLAFHSTAPSLLSRLVSPCWVKNTT